MKRWSDMTPHERCVAILDRLTSRDREVVNEMNGCLFTGDPKVAIRVQQVSEELARESA